MRRLVAVFVLLVSLTACDGRARRTQTQHVSNPLPVHCTVIADGPKRDAEPPKTIVGRIRFRCDRPGVEILALSVKLERLTGTTWAAVTTQTFTAQGADTHAAFFKYHSRTVSVACAAGRFRTTVAWARRSNTPTTTGTARSGAMLDPCAPRLFG